VHLVEFFETLIMGSWFIYGDDHPPSSYFCLLTAHFLLYTGRYCLFLTPISYILYPNFAPNSYIPYPITVAYSRQPNMTMKKVTKVIQSLITCCKIITYEIRGDSRIEKRLQPIGMNGLTTAKTPIWPSLTPPH
jgi:hypothetical protein